MAKLQLKLHDTWPPVESTLKGTNAENEKVPIDLTNAEKVKFIMKPKIGSPITGLCKYPSPSSGVVIYEWTAGQTSTEGLYRVEYEIIWKTPPFPAGSVQSVPNGNWDEIEIVEDLG